MNLLTALAPLGAKYKIQIVPEYNDGTLTLAVIYSLKSETEPVIKSLSFTGTPEEVEAALVKDLAAMVEKLAAHATQLEELDAQLKAELEAKKEKAKPKVEEPKPALKAPSPQAKHTPPAKGKAAETNKPKHAVKPGAAKLQPETPPPATTTEALPPAGLTPAWKQAQPVEKVSAPAEPVAPEPADLGSLFEETQPATP